MSIISASTILKAHNLKPRGVVQVGAHHGEEVDELLSDGFERIHLIEANPELMPRLAQHLSKHPEITLANIAISDAIGTATLKLTSESMSFSLLDLALHAKLFPSIRPVSELAVQTQTLDAHVEVQGLRAEDFNVLIIDVQGAELKVFAGAKRFLRFIDVVICEVNFAELYRGCALISDLDLFLFDQGFIRVATASPYDPSWGDAAYVRSNLISELGCLQQRRQNVVAMPTLGSNGRLANQMFQYLFLVLYGLRSSCDVEAPPSDLQKYFTLPLGSRQTRELPELRLLSYSEAAFALETIKPPRDVAFFGYFQAVTPAHVRHRSLVRRLFEPKEPIRSAFAEWWTQVRSKYRRVIAIHIRRGDYTEFEPQRWMQFSRTPVEWYKTWLVKNGNISPEDGLFISTDDPEVWKGFLEYRLVESEMPLPAEHDREILEFLALTSSDVALLVNSSWSYMAALLAPETQRAHRVDFRNQTFVPFNAWSTDDFWSSYQGVDAELTDRRAVGLQTLLDCQFEKAQLALMMRTPVPTFVNHWRDLVISKYGFGRVIRNLAPGRHREAYRAAAIAATERLAHTHRLLHGRPCTRLLRRLGKQRETES